MRPKSGAESVSHLPYFEKLSEADRRTLEKVRGAILAAAPKAKECMSYGLPAFEFEGRPLVAIGASAKHCAFYPMSASTVAALADDLKKYDTSKGTIRFPAAKPIPATLVRKLVKARMAEIAAGAGTNSTKPNRATKKPAGRSAKSAVEAGKDAAVEAFMKGLDHPLKPAIETLRKIILGVSPEVREGIKWNAPSFRIVDDFATFNLRGKGGEDRVMLILHTGAKVKKRAKPLTIDDPQGLLKWLAADRAVVTFADVSEIRSAKRALEAIVRAWIEQL